MDKQKQIEEMAKVLESKHLSMCTWDSYNDDFNDNYPNECKKVATALYDAGYRKIPEGAVVLTREEYDELQKGIKTYNYTAMINARDTYRWEQGYVQGCKETAEKFAERLKSHPIAKTWFLYNADGKINVVIDEICKELIGDKE